MQHMVPGTLAEAEAEAVVMAGCTKPHSMRSHVPSCSIQTIG